MLDTNIVSDLIRNPQGRVFDRIAALGGDVVCISIITAAELRYGCTKKGSLRLLAQVEAILESIEILAFDVSADAEYAGIRVELEAAGEPIGPNDLLIAAHACAFGATLVTANVGESSVSEDCASRTGWPDRSRSAVREPGAVARPAWRFSWRRFRSSSSSQSRSATTRKR